MRLIAYSMYKSEKGFASKADLNAIEVLTIAGPHGNPDVSTARVKVVHVTDVLGGERLDIFMIGKDEKTWELIGETNYR